VFVASGSIHESPESAGVTHLLEKLAFKDTAHRSHMRIVQEVEATGGNVGASASREQMVYSYDTLKAYVPQAVELLLDSVRNPLFLQEEVDRQVLNIFMGTVSLSQPVTGLLWALIIVVDVLLAFQLALAREDVQEMQKNPERFLQEVLNLVGYEGAIANPLICPEEALETINADIIKKFYHVMLLTFDFCIRIMDMTLLLSCSHLHSFC
jgi:processing peptidase subunit alpha